MGATDMWSGELSRYGEWLKALRIVRLEKRILGGIMIVYFKYLKGWYIGKDKCSLFFQKVIILGIAMGEFVYFSSP